MISLQVGDKAPSLSVYDQDKTKIALKDFSGKKLVIFFYPAASTPTCTVQACNLRDNINLLKRNGIEVVGISVDDIAKQKKFKSKNELPFPLLADVDHTIVNAYGVWQNKVLFGKKYMGIVRTTFLIDEKGVIIKIFEKPKSKMHAEEIIAFLKGK